jgi:hypothetical protein
MDSSSCAPRRQQIENAELRGHPELRSVSRPVVRVVKAADSALLSVAARFEHDVAAVEAADGAVVPVLRAADRGELDVRGD